MTTLVIVVNDQPMMQYDRDKELPEKQQYYLQTLDKKFDQGIELQSEKIDYPDMEQRAKFMALSLMEGIMYKEDNKAAASMSWLATRLPDLKQVKAIVDQDGTHFELVFDREYQPHQVVHFDGFKLQ